MTATADRWVAILGGVLAVVWWWRSRALLRHDALVLVGILTYFLLGTINIDFLSEDWSPRFNITQRVWMVVAVGVWGYLAGAALGRWRSVRAHRRPDPPPSRLDRDGLLLEVVGWAGLVALLVIYRAPALTGANREAESGYLTTVAELLIPAYLVRFAAAKDNVPRQLWMRAIAAALGLLVSGYRTYTLVLLLSLGCLWFIGPRRVAQRVRAVVLAILLVLTVGVGFGYWRFLREDGGGTQALIQSAIGSTDASALDIAGAFVYVAFFREGPSILGFLVERHPAMEPYTHGAAAWGMITSPLPGEQWDARAIISKEVYGVRETSLVSSIFGPWYLDFGPVGVFLGLAFFGYVLSRLEAGALRDRRPVHLAAYCYVLVLVGLSIHSGLSDFVFAVLIPLVFLWTTRSSGTSHSPVAEPN